MEIKSSEKVGNIFLYNKKKQKKEKKTKILDS